MREELDNVTSLKVRKVTRDHLAKLGSKSGGGRTPAENA
jgi:hypothetical protein